MPDGRRAPAMDSLGQSGPACAEDCALLTLSPRAPQRWGAVAFQTDPKAPAGMAPEIAAVPATDLSARAGWSSRAPPSATRILI
jgi:hypothetical protein